MPRSLLCSCFGAGDDTFRQLSFVGPTVGVPVVGDGTVLDGSCQRRLRSYLIIMPCDFLLEKRNGDSGCSVIEGRGDINGIVRGSNLRPPLSLQFCTMSAVHKGKKAVQANGQLRYSAKHMVTGALVDAVSNSSAILVVNNN